MKYLHELGRSNTSLFCSDVIHFGYPYSDGELSALERRVLSMKAQIKNYSDLVARTEKHYGIRSRIDLPLIPASNRASYLNAKKKLSILRRDLDPVEREFKFKKLSRESARTQPTVFDIVEYAKKKNAYPKDITDQFYKDHLDFAYPTFILEKAKNLHYKHKTFVNADEPPIMSSHKWYMEAIKQVEEDSNLTEKPLSKLVKKRKDAFDNMVKIIKNDHHKFIRLKTLQRLGRASNAELNWIKEVEDNAQMAGVNYQNEKVYVAPLSKEDQALAVYQQQMNDLDEEGMGFLKKLFKKVLSPFEKLVVSPFMKLANATIGPVAKTVLPKDLYLAVSGLSHASARLLVGDISKENLRNVSKGFLRTVGGTITMPVRATVEVTRQAQKLSIVRSIDKYSGGLISSADNLNRATVSLGKGKSIDLKSTLMDGVKIGLAVVSGGQSVVAMTATNAVGAKTGLNKTAIGKIALTAAQAAGTSGNWAGFVSNTGKQIATQEGAKTLVKTGVIRDQNLANLVVTTGMVASGSSSKNLLKDVGTHVAKTEGARQLVKTGVIRDKNLANLAVSGALVSTGSDASFTDVAKDLAKSEAERVAKKEIVKEIGNDDLGLLVANTAIGTYDEGFTMNNLSKNAISNTSLLAEQKANEKLAKYGLSVNTLTKASEIASMSPEEMQAIVKDRATKAMQEMEAKKNMYMMKVEHLKEKIADASNTDLKAKLQAEFERAEEKLAVELEDAKKRANAELERMKQDYKDFNMGEFISDEQRRLKERALAERDRFKANYMNHIYKLRDKYGPHLLAYLMYKYGPRPDYNVTDEDRLRYRNWQPPQNGRLYQTNYSLGKLALGGLAVIGTLYAIS